MSITIDEKLRRTIGDRICYITKGEEDIIDALSKTSITLMTQMAMTTPPDQIFPTGNTATTQHTTNTIIDFFKDIPAEKIFEDQYAVLLKSPTWSSSHIYLTAVKGLPFLTFANSHLVQIPLGVQPCSLRLKEASLLERIIAITKMDRLTLDKEDWYDESPLIAIDSAIQATYYNSRYADRLESDLEVAVESGFIKPLSGPGDHYQQYELRQSKFSWNP